MKILFEKYRFWLNCWGVVFATLCVVFSFYMMTFYVGNHDFPFMRFGVDISDGLWEGRLTQFVLPVVLLHGQVLPILGAFIGLCCFAGAAVLLAKWYGLPEKYLPIIIFALLITLNPYVCTQLYYVYTVISVLSWHLFSVIGVVCAWQYTENFKLKYLAGAVLCLWAALAGYAPSLELILTVCAGKLLTDVLHYPKIDKALMKRYFILGLIVAVAVLGNIFAVYVLKQTKILSTQMYNVQTLALKDALALLITAWNAPFKILLMDMPFVADWYGYLYILLLGLVLLTAYHKKRLVFCVLTLIGLFYAAFLLAYFSPFGIFKAMRIHSFSVPYIAAILFTGIIIDRNRGKQNLTFLVGLCLLLMFLKADFMVEKVWYLGTNQDELVVDRARATLMPELDKSKHYRLSTVGSLYGRQKFAGFDELSVENRETYREYYGYGLYLYKFFSSGLFMYENINPIWGDATYLGNYLSYFVNEENVSLSSKLEAGVFAKHYGTDKDKLITAADRLCAYPCKNFYYVGQKDILLMLSDDEISRMVLRWNIENEGKF